MIEAKTYRYYGHFQGDAVTYRTEEELLRYRDRDPIAGCKKYLKEHDLATEEELDAIDARVVDQIDQAWLDARNAPWPAPEDALTDVYVSY